MKLGEFDFYLPEDRIARFPSQKRDESRLMLVNRKTGTISHHRFKDIVDLIDEKDFLVINNSRVIPVKLFGTIGGRPVEMLIVKTLGNHEVEALTLPARRFKPGEKVLIENAGDLWAGVTAVGHRGRRILRFDKPFAVVLQKAGYAPLPPYIKRKYDEAITYRALDLERYQTVYAKVPGSIAAPTAGLHFTPEVLEKIKKKSPVLEITLEVGEATFQKIEVEDITGHRMGKETITITAEVRQKIRALKQSRHLIAVGTTTVRSLETWALYQPQEETFYSELFISPGFELKMVDKLFTNFHLPKSSLFILVSAFAGLELMKEAYREAVSEGYRFFSYGDAMFIV
jgi:S-adenosylmethionine:tRNA ribosyltransferase-isomerase